MAERSRQSRRDFLSGKSAVDALGDALAGPAPELPPPAGLNQQPGSHLLSVSREAMACLFEIVFDAAQYRDRTDVAVDALDVVERLEAQLTVYRDTSEVMALNRQASEAPVVVEEHLFGLLQRAVDLSRQTGGAFDITAGRLSQVWGFYRRQGRMPSAREVAEALESVGWQSLQLDAAIRTVRFQKRGVELNLGAIGKGYSLDRTGEALAAGGIDNFLIHGGNSSVLARGTKVDAQQGWSVGLRHPLKPGDRLAEFWLANQALGTSGSGTQFFHHQGKRYGHIIDPRSGWPADQVLSATVIAPTAEQADALSTALYVMGLDAARAFCERHPELSALLVTPASAAAGIELHALNLPDDRWRRL
jgi:FAD:protein FMN transferase